MTASRCRLAAVVFQLAGSCIEAWVSPMRQSKRARFSLPQLSIEIPNEKDVVDVDFERSYSDKARPGDRDARSNEQSKSPRQNGTEAPRNLLDLSFDSGDPQWREARIPFCQGDEYIDGKLAFTIDLEGTTYGIGVPFDDAVALVKVGQGDIEDVVYYNPDEYEANEETQELMEVMAEQVKKQLGEEFTLRKTPRILTISGGLGNITDDWRNLLMPTPASIQELMEATNSEDDELSEFITFMKSELGEEEFKKTIDEELSDKDMQLLECFEIPGMHNKTSTLRDELVGELEKEANDGVADAVLFEPKLDGVSLKLLAFNFADGRSYSLAKLMQPYVLLGKYIQGSSVRGKGDIRFELLSPEEEQLVIPKIEKICHEDLEEAGLSSALKP